MQRYRTTTETSPDWVFFVTVSDSQAVRPIGGSVELLRKRKTLLDAASRCETCEDVGLGAETGLRRKELQSLKVSSFDFKAGMVRVNCAYTKNKKTAVVPLRSDTAAELQSFFAGKMPSVKALGGTYKPLTNKTADMLKADLADAGIPYVDSAARYADFHCLRHTTGSLLAASGVHPKVAQSIMRHSDINLTMPLYTHTLRGQESEAVKSLPDLSLPSRESLRASGTDKKAVETDSSAYKKLTKKSYFNSLSRSPFGTTSEPKNQKDGEVSTVISLCK